VRLALVLLLALGACTSSRGPAPVEDRKPPPPRAAVKPFPTPQATETPPAPAAPEGFYVVRRGDTLYSIALEHGHDYRELAQWNSLEDPGRIRAGQLLRVVPPPEPAVVIGEGRTSGGIESRPLEGKPPAAVVVAPPAPVATPPAPPPAATAPAQPADFIWPAKGKLLAGFAEPRQKGIDIGGKVGDPVIAAAAGRVTYVGSGIPGLGKLVVIKHDNGFITVYAHNKDILVKEQQAVARGQRIAELGEKLHFQIRKGAAAVDPLLYLPKS
jgi:lipoprotein NlpD